MSKDGPEHLWFRGWSDLLKFWAILQYFQIAWGESPEAILFSYMSWSDEAIFRLIYSSDIAIN